VSFVAEGEVSGLMRVGEPVIKRLMARQSAGYHRNLRRHLTRSTSGP
jgi:hypothetical protein